MALMPSRGGTRLSVHRPVGDRRSRRGTSTGATRESMSRTAAAERCFLSHSPTLRPWIACRRLRELAMTVVLRGGALEPEPPSIPENVQAKADTYSQRAFPAEARRVFLSQ